MTATTHRVDSEFSPDCETTVLVDVNAYEGSGDNVIAYIHGWLAPPLSRYDKFEWKGKKYWQERRELSPELNRSTGTIRAVTLQVFLREITDGEKGPR